MKSFDGHSYELMARHSNYASGYLKVVGARLWQELSTVLGQKVSKKNLQTVLGKHLNNKTSSSMESERSASVLVPAPSARSPLLPQMAHNGTFSADLSQLDSPLSLDSPFYIERPPLEVSAYQTIERAGCLLRMKAPRRYGKSSLLLRLIDRASSLGYRTVVIDLQEAEQTTMRSAPLLLRWVCANFIRQLQLETDLDQIWNCELGSKLSCKAFLQEQVLEPSAVPVLWIINEVDRVFEYPDVARDFLSLLRACYEQAQGALSWRKLRLVIACSTEVYVSLQLNQSPFNVGTSLQLLPFSLGQAADLSKRYGLRLKAAELGQVTGLVGGQPYLLNLAFFNLSARQMPLAELLRVAPTLSGIYRNHLQRCLSLVLEKPDLLSALSLVLKHPDGVELEPIVAYQLASAGLVTLDGYRVRMSCRLYREYFSYVICQQASVA